MNYEPIDRIVRDFMDNTIPHRYRQTVARWLMSEWDKDQKNASLKRIFDEAEDDDLLSIEKPLDIFRYNRNEYEEHRRNKHIVYTVMRYAAIFLLPVLTGLLVWQYTEKHYYVASELVELYVPEGETGHLTLSDGTVVMANGGSTFLYPRTFNPRYGNRDVYLQGEAHFKVAKDSRRPFIVNLGKLKVRVLGTQFNIKAYTDNNHIITTLLQGKVSVYDEKSAAILLPNEQVDYNKLSGRLTKGYVDAKKINGWTTGNLYFDQQPLEDILADLEHRYNVKFRVDPSVRLTHRYTMNFKPSETIDDVLVVLAKLSNGLRYNKQEQIIKLSQERKEKTNRKKDM